MTFDEFQKGCLRTASGGDSGHKGKYAAKWYFRSGR